MPEVFKVDDNFVFKPGHFATGVHCPDCRELLQLLPSSDTDLKIHLTFNHDCLLYDWSPADIYAFARAGDFDPYLNNNSLLDPS